MKKFLGKIAGFLTPEKTHALHGANFEVEISQRNELLAIEKQKSQNLKADKNVIAEANRMLKSYQDALQSGNGDRWVMLVNIANLVEVVYDKDTCTYCDRDLTQETIKLYMSLKENDEYTRTLEKLNRRK